MAARLRTGGSIAMLAVACGPVLGTLWWLLAPRIVYVVRRGGVYTAPESPSDWFGVDGWFLVLGTAAGLLLGCVAYWRWRDRPVAAVLGLAAGCLGMAALAWWVGHVLGPDALKAQLAAAHTGDRLQRPLDLTAFGVLVAPATAAVAIYGALVLAGRTTEPPVPGPIEPEVVPDLG